MNNDATPPSETEPVKKAGKPKLGNHIFWKMFTIVSLVLFLLIPLNMVNGVISERQMRQFEVTEEISSTWAGRQTLQGPFLALPYWYVDTTTDDKGVKHQETKFETAYILPKDYQVKADITPEIRSRGIYNTTVYTSVLHIKGSFDLAMADQLDLPEQQLSWDKAYLVMGIPSVKGISKKPTLSWQHQPMEWLPGVDNTSFITSGLHAPLPVKLLPKTGDVPFDIQLNLNGSQMMSLTPIGKQNHFEMVSTWPSPSFIGNTLPTQRAVSEKGFSAQWDIPYFARNYDQVVSSGSLLETTLNESAVGAELLNTVDFYHQSERAIKYGILFLVLTFSTYFLFEVLCKHRLSALQYILIGFSLSLFYLLLVSLSEVLGFATGYAIASVATISSISLYSSAILAQAKKHAGWIIAGLLSVLYGYLYVLLQLEDYSLLFGTLGLFIVLSTIMYITRNIDWSQSQTATA